IASNDPEAIMPPPKFNKPLKPEQVKLIQQWIDHGATWSEHWAFVPPKKPSMPQAADGGWVRNPIDAFIYARLQTLGLRPSPEADRAMLVRRVTFDLTGLPPTIDEVEAALNDKSSNWYEKVVDRLLQSPRY